MPFHRDPGVRHLLTAALAVVAATTAASASIGSHDGVQSLGGGLVLIGVRPDSEPDSDRLYAFDMTTYDETCSIPVVIQDGPAVLGMTGVATNPTTNQIYVLAKLDGFPGSERRLLLVDPTTGSATNIGNTGHAFANIAFSSDGTLYGVTGERGPNTETLFVISLVDASATVHTTLGNGDDGEAIAFNPDDGLLYHWSGLNPFPPVGEAAIMETITIPDSPGTVTNVPLAPSDPAYQEVMGAAYIGNDRFVLTTSAGGPNSEIWFITTTGVMSDGASLDERTRGFAIARDLDGDGCPDQGGGFCPADVDGSGAVDFEDLLEVLSAWGPCS